MSLETIEIISLLGILVSTGLIAGLAAGIMGIGGGAVLVPVFFQIFNYLGIDPSVSMHLSVGSSLAIIVPTSIQSLRAHHAKGAVDVDLLKKWALPVLGGVILGTLVASYVSSDVLRTIFAAIVLVVSIKLFLGKITWHLGKEIPPNPLLSIYGIIIGCFSTLMGVGGGVIGNTIQALYNRPIHQSVATSSGLGFLISLPGALGFMWAGWGDPALPQWSFGFVNLIIVAVVAPVSFFAAPMGARIAHALPKRKLELVFAFFLIFVAIRFIASLT